jgi:hypothetical protein
LKKLGILARYDIIKKIKRVQRAEGIEQRAILQFKICNLKFTI